VFHTIPVGNYVIGTMKVVLRDVNIIKLNRRNPTHLAKETFGIVFFAEQSTPDILVHVKASFMICMSLTGLQCSFHYPHSVKFPTHQIGELVWENWTGA
jgi:hypothetical protein